MTATDCLSHPWLTDNRVYVEVLHTLETAWMKGLLARRRWHRWYHAIIAMNRMRKLSEDNRWRQTPRRQLKSEDGAAANNNNHAHTNGQATGSETSSARSFSSPRHLAHEVSAAIVRQMQEWREACSRQMAHLADKLHPSRENSVSRQNDNLMEATADHNAVTTTFEEHNNSDDVVNNETTAVDNCDVIVENHVDDNYSYNEETTQENYIEGDNTEEYVDYSTNNGEVYDHNYDTTNNDSTIVYDTTDNSYETTTVT